MQRISSLFFSLWIVGALAAANAQEDYSEAPQLARLVEAGELPPVEERMPEADDILVVEPVEEVGEYGGTLRYMHSGPHLVELRALLYDPPIRWNRNYSEYIPGLFKDWEVDEDELTITFFMRRGLRWSDGEPFTSDDILFWWEDMVLDEGYIAMTAPIWAIQEGEIARLEVIDDYAFRFHLAGTDWNMPYLLATGFWNFEKMMTPRHYLSQFHPRYNQELDDYSALEAQRHWWTIPGYPTLLAWQLVEYDAGVRAVLERNPYYWKVDTEGNQLPYIDRIVSLELPGEDVRVAQLVDGNIDLAFHTLGSARNWALLEDTLEGSDYRLLGGWLIGAGGFPTVAVNQDFVGDAYIRELLRDPDFRRALSLAIDREEVNELLWFGLGTPQQATITEESWHFEEDEGREVFEEWAASYANYDPERANELLDAAGLAGRDELGWRVRADNGQPLELILDVIRWDVREWEVQQWEVHRDWEVLQDWEIIQDWLIHKDWEILQEAAALFKDYWEAVGVSVIINDLPSPQLDLRLRDGIYMLRLFNKSAIDLWTSPHWVFPVGVQARVWPLQALWLQTGGVRGEPATEVTQRLYDLYLEGIAIPEPEDRHELVWEAIRIHIEEGPFDIGATGGLPAPAVAHESLRNIPDFGIIGPWEAGAPGNTDPWQYFFGE
jgi:peptide/nickel transport system substrate-binding protein